MKYRATTKFSWNPRKDVQPENVMTPPAHDGIKPKHELVDIQTAQHAGRSAVLLNPFTADPVNPLTP